MFDRRLVLALAAVLALSAASIAVIWRRPMKLDKYQIMAERTERLREIWRALDSAASALCAIPGSDDDLRRAGVDVDRMLRPPRYSDAPYTINYRILLVPDLDPNEEARLGRWLVADPGIVLPRRASTSDVDAFSRCWLTPSGCVFVKSLTLHSEGLRMDLIECFPSGELAGR